LLITRPPFALNSSIALHSFPTADYAQQAAQEPKPPAQQPPPTTPPSEAQQPPTFVREVNLVDVLLTVLDRRNKLVSDLEKGDFKIVDDNSPQEIRFFSKQSDLPLRIGMLMDTSNSIRDRIKFEQEAAVDFLYSVLRRGKDQAFAMTFDDEPQIIQAFTGDGGLLRDEINKTRAGGGTAVYDAIYEACSKQLSNPPRPPGDQPDVVRRVMVLISDGDELRNQDTITYSTSDFVANGKYHRINIAIPNHNGDLVRARRGYFAKSQTSAATPAQSATPPAPAGQSPPVKP